MISAAEFLKWLEVFGITPGGGGDITIPVAMGQGGTGSVLSPSNGSLFYSTASAGALLATSANGVLVTNSLGIPSISTTLPAGLTIPGYTPIDPSTFLQVANNLDDVANVATARTNLGLDSMALQPANNVDITGGTVSPTTLSYDFIYVTVSGDTDLLATNTNVLFELTQPNIGIADVLGISAYTLGFQFIMKNSSNGNVTFTPKSGDVIDGLPSLTLTPFQSVIISRLESAWGACASYQNLSLPIPVTSGGTGLTGLTALSLLFASATDTVGQIATDVNSVLVTDGSGNPSYSVFLPDAVKDQIDRLAPQNVDLDMNGHNIINGLNIQLGNPGRILDPNGNVYLSFLLAAGAVNNVEIFNAATGNPVLITGVGIDTNVSMQFQTQGNGGFSFTTNGAGNPLFQLVPVASGVNFITSGNNITANNPNMTATGSDASVGFDFRSKGGVFQFYDFTTTNDALVSIFSASGQAIGLKAPPSLGATVDFVLPPADGLSGYVLTTDGAGNLSFQAGGGGGGGITNGGIGTNQLLYGSSSTAAVSSSINQYDPSANVFSILGANTLTNVLGGSQTFTSGVLHTLGGGSNNSVVMGYSNTNNSNLGFVFGISCTANGGQGFALGTHATQTNIGSYVFTDSTGGTPPTDTAANQFVSSFAGGHYFYAGVTPVLISSIDGEGNNIKNAGGNADQSKSVVTPTTGNTVAVISTLIINPAGSLLALTITLPGSPIDGQEVRFSCSQVVTTLTVNPGTASIKNAPVAFAAGQGYAMIFDAPTTTWYRIY